jgi:hypothetical protein
MTIRPLSTVLAAFAVFLAAASATLAASPPLSPPAVARALGNEGQLYELFAGAYGELFAGDLAYPADTPVLALEVVQADGEKERHLMPGTAGPEVKGVPTLVFEDSSQRLFAVWESKSTPTASRLLLADFIPGGWSEPLEISGDIAPLKDAPQVLVTRDRFSIRTPAGEMTTRSRTVIHVVWLEEGSEGNEYYYTPVILEAGQYIGWNPVVALAQIEPEAPSQKAAAEIVELLRAPELAPGEDLHSAILAFLSPKRGRLTAVELRLAPGELGFLADDFRAQIIEIGARDREGFDNLAKRFRAQIIEIGNRLNPGVVNHFAERCSSALLGLFDADPDRPLEQLADDFRAQIIEIGRELLGGGRGNAAAASRLLEVSPVQWGNAPTPPNAPRVSHLVSLQVVMDRPAPPLGDVPARMFVSEDGERVLVGWLDRGKVYYTETSAEVGATEGAWTAVERLILTDELEATAAAEILEKRVRRRR